MTSVFTSELCFIIATSQKTNKTWAEIHVYYFAYATICADVGLIPTVMMQILDGIAVTCKIKLLLFHKKSSQSGNKFQIITRLEQHRLIP